MGSNDQVKDSASVATAAADNAGQTAETVESKTENAAETATQQEEADKAESEAADKAAAGDSKDADAPMGCDSKDVEEVPKGDKPEGAGESDKDNLGEQSGVQELDPNAVPFNPFSDVTSEGGQSSGKGWKTKGSGKGSGKGRSGYRRQVLSPRGMRPDELQGLLDKQIHLSTDQKRMVSVLR